MWFFNISDGVARCFRWCLETLTSCIRLGLSFMSIWWYVDRTIRLYFGTDDLLALRAFALVKVCRIIPMLSKFVSYIVTHSAQIHSYGIYQMMLLHHNPSNNFRSPVYDGCDLERHRMIHVPAMARYSEAQTRKLIVHYWITLCRPRESELWCAPVSLSGK